MTKHTKRRQRRSKPGTPPGTLKIDVSAPQPRVQIIAYGPEGIEEENLTVLEIPTLRNQFSVVWVNVVGLGDAATLKSLGEHFGLHPLTLEDVVDTPQRPKIEAYDEQLFVVIQLLSVGQELSREQLSLCLGSGFVVTFQERAGDPFGPVRKRLQKTGGRFRQSGSDYLAYALLDAVVDDYFPVIDALEDMLDALEEDLRTPQPDDPIDRIQHARTEVREVRRALLPLRELTRSLAGGEWPNLSDATQVYMRDCHDHVLEAIDQLESCREIAAGLIDAHLSTVSYQANQTMRVLTVIATIFMPLTFIVGIYGMNFNPDLPGNMPELNWPYGYVVSLVLMAAVGIGFGAYFKRKGWF